MTAVSAAAVAAAAAAAMVHMMMRFGCHDLDIECDDERYQNLVE